MIDPTLGSISCPTISETHFAPTEPKKRNNDVNTLRTDIAASLDSLIGLTVAA